MDTFAALPESHLMIALLELDVTAALVKIAKLQRAGTRISLFSFVTRSIAVAISEHPELNLMAHGRRIVRFEDVDVSVPVEIESANGKFPREVVVRRAQHKSAAEIYAELDAARTRYVETREMSAEDRWARRTMRVLMWLPRPVRIAILRRLLRNAFRVKRHAGTVLVTSVAKFASIPGFAFTFSTGPRAAAFAVGSVVDKPWAHQGQIALRSILSLSLMVNHDLVDGAPAARFARRLQELVELAGSFG